MTTTSGAAPRISHSPPPSCRGCRVCGGEWAALVDMWENQTRSIAELQALLAVARGTREHIRQRPAPAA